MNKKNSLKLVQKKPSDLYRFFYKSNHPLIIMTWKLWVALSIAIIALVVLVVALIRLHNYEKKLHSKIKTYQHGRL